MLPSSDFAIGIDLGTTNSCVAIFDNGEVKILFNSDGFRTTPSVVAFKDNEQLVGNAAMGQEELTPKTTINNAKRMIGRTFYDPKLQSYIAKFPFTVIRQESKPVIEVQVGKETKYFTPEDISSMILQELKKTAEACLGREVEKAVITVPAYFNDGQRQATIEAAKMAGLNVIRIINEPTAATLAFGFEKKFEEKQNILIFDFGGGTLDVSILTICPNDEYKVMATSGDTNLGGLDIDEMMAQHFWKQFREKNGIDVTEDRRALNRLRNACEKAKRILSSAIEQTIVVAALFDGIDFEAKISREQLEEMCKEIIQKTLKPVERALSDANMDKSQIDEVVMVGGSTRILKVRQALESFFEKKASNSAISPDEAVAYGAAIQAAILSGVRYNSVGKVIVCDVTPLSLGVEADGNSMSILIERNSSLPVQKTEQYTTTQNFQTSVVINIYEGERPIASQNHKLGEFELHGLPSLPRGKAIIDVTFKIDENGILSVAAEEKSTGRNESLIITKGRLKSDEASRMVEEAKKFKLEDELHQDRVEARKKLANYVSEVEQIIEENVGKLPKKTSDMLISTLSAEKRWLSENVHAAKEVVVFRHWKIEEICNPTIKKLKDGTINKSRCIIV